jgi:DNA-binding GntR family transcriptional regulator
VIASPRCSGAGLVELRPSRSAVVAEIDAEDLRQIYRLRISIEATS